MFRLLAVVVAVIGVAYVAAFFIGSVLEQRAIAQRGAIVHDHPTGQAAVPPSPAPETKR